MHWWWTNDDAKESERQQNPEKERWHWGEIMSVTQSVRLNVCRCHNNKQLLCYQVTKTLACDKSLRLIHTKSRNVLHVKCPQTRMSIVTDEKSAECHVNNVLIAHRYSTRQAITIYLSVVARQRASISAATCRVCECTTCCWGSSGSSSIAHLQSILFSRLFNRAVLHQDCSLRPTGTLVAP